jgi:hypothetical protein
MENKPSTDNRSPWPACADCHVGEEEASSDAKADEPGPRADAGVDGADGWDQLEPCADLGLRRDEVRRLARDAFARALERARARTEPKE